jgi:hypothetical protein
VDEPGFEGFRLVKQVAPPPWVIHAASFPALSLVLLAAREVSFSGPIIDLPIFNNELSTLPPFASVRCSRSTILLDHHHRDHSVDSALLLTAQFKTRRYDRLFSTQLVRANRFDIGIAASTRAYASGSGESPSGTFTLASAPMCRYCH